MLLNKIIPIIIQFTYIGYSLCKRLSNYGKDFPFKNITSRQHKCTYIPQPMKMYLHTLTNEKHISILYQRFHNLHLNVNRLIENTIKVYTFF